MNRKHFVSSLMGGISISSLGNIGLASPWRPPDEMETPSIIPPYLKPGDIIGITCPAGYITHEEILSSIQEIERWGFKLRIGDTVGKKDFTFGGTDEERARDFQAMLDDPSVRAILCARGGYGAIRMVDRLDFSRFISHPKWILGFSDITIIHAHLQHHFGVASIHSKMCNSFPEDWTKAEPVQVETIHSIRKALVGETMHYELPAHSHNRSGMGEGELAGGNLKTLETLAGSTSDLPTAGKILFVEDTGEYLYSIDRMFWNLKRTGKLDKLAGLIIGGFKLKPDDPGEEFSKTLFEIVREKVNGYPYPVCFDFPVGHQKNNYALKCGVKHRLNVQANGVTLNEIAGSG